MDLQKAKDLFSDAYQDRETVEVSMMLKLCTFTNRSVLEVGTAEPSTVAPLIKSVVKSYKSVALDNTSGIKNQSFDIVLCRWHIHESSSIVKTIKEMCRIASESVIVITQSEHGDFTKLKMLKDKSAHDRRKKRLLEIKQSLSSNGFAVHDIPIALDFSFKSLNEALEILLATEFNSSVSYAGMNELSSFLKKYEKKGKVVMSQGAEIIAGVRRTRQ
ncbi:MAG: hypothetical protein ABIG30_01560 [Candidatus Aenigmatarchaeota archaeon]